LIEFIVMIKLTVKLTYKYEMTYKIYFQVLFIFLPNMITKVKLRERMISYKLFGL